MRAISFSSKNCRIAIAVWLVALPWCSIHNVSFSLICSSSVRIACADPYDVKKGKVHHRTWHESPEQRVQAQLYFFFNLGPTQRWVVNATPRSFFPWGRDPVRVVQEAVWASEPIWTGEENLSPTGTRFPDPCNTSSLMVSITLCMNNHTDRRYSVRYNTFIGL